MIRHLSTSELIARARELYTRGAYAQALEDLELVVWREPGFADMHNLTGLCCLQLSRLSDALDSFSRAVGLNADYAEAHLNRARVLQEFGEHADAAQARAMAARLLEHRPGERYAPDLAAILSNHHKDLGVLYAQSGFLREASEQFRRASEISPGYADIRNCLGQVLMELGLDEAAVREFQVALEINPSYLEARVNLGLGLFRMAAFEEAEKEWRHCLVQDPAHVRTRACLEMLRQEMQKAQGQEPTRDTVAA